MHEAEDSPAAMCLEHLVVEKSGHRLREQDDKEYNPNDGVIATLAEVGAFPRSVVTELYL